MQEIIIDATNAIAGRLATFVAKKALQGNRIIIVNSEKALLTGRPAQIYEKYLKKFQLGRGVQKGPILSRKPELILRRIIRGMLPWKRTRGKQAFKRIKCFKGVPDTLKNKQILSFERKPRSKYITLEQLSKLIGK